MKCKNENLFFFPLSPFLSVSLLLFSNDLVQENEIQRRWRISPSVIVSTTLRALEVNGPGLWMTQVQSNFPTKTFYCTQKRMKCFLSFLITHSWAVCYHSLWCRQLDRQGKSKEGFRDGYGPRGIQTYVHVLLVTRFEKGSHLVLRSDVDSERGGERVLPGQFLLPFRRLVCLHTTSRRTCPERWSAREGIQSFPSCVPFLVTGKTGDEQGVFRMEILY